MAVLPQPQTEGTQLTIRIGLYSEDRNLQPLLASALGKEFQILSSLDEAGITRTLDADECVVAILDLDVKPKSSEQRSLEQRLECFRRIIASRESAVIGIMAQDKPFPKAG